MKNCLIMGSGRSGTSMLAGILYNSGYYLGDNLYAPNESNPKGFFENRFINGINEEIIVETRKKNRDTNFLYPQLKDMQMWLEVFPPGIEIFSNISTERKIKKALSVQPFCYKDPRFSYTLPAWIKHLDEIIILVVFRHPSITAKSIIKECNRRKYLKDVKMSFKRAIEIWESMYSHILKNYETYRSENIQWKFINYYQLFKEEKILELEGILAANLDKSFPEAAFNRTREKESVPRHIAELYKKLCKLAEYNEEMIIKEKKEKLNDVYFIKMDIKLLLSKKNKTDKEKLRLILNYLKLNNFQKACFWFKKLIMESSKKEVIFEAFVEFSKFKSNCKLEKNLTNKLIKATNSLSPRSLNKLQIYRIASLYKKIGNMEKSEKWFRQILKNQEMDSLKAGAYFHLGEIELKRGDRKKAYNLFKNCVKINPKHAKAKKYLESLKYSEK